MHQKLCISRSCAQLGEGGDCPALLWGGLSSSAGDSFTTMSEGSKAVGDGPKEGHEDGEGSGGAEDTWNVQLEQRRLRGAASDAQGGAAGGSGQGQELDQ